MRKTVMAIGFVLLLSAGTAEAGLGTWVSNSVVYLYRPIPALWNYGSGLVSCAIEKSVIFIKEVVGNVNANPATLKPFAPLPVPQPGS